MKRMAFLCMTTASVLGLAALGGCDDRLAMQPARDHSVETASVEATSAPAQVERVAARERADRAERPQRVSAPVRLVGGRPMWADNRSHTAEENVQYQFEHHGVELRAKDVDDFVAKAHRFVNSPPDGALTLTRANGDRLLFDPRSKLFGVVRSDGAPRTVFKPETGQAYWDQQVAAERGGERGRGTRRAARTTDRDDRG
jgi:pyocin large subunit-like protein